MVDGTNIQNIKSRSWDIENMVLNHYVIDYVGPGINRSKNDSEYVRLHFGLQGSYEFSFAQLNARFALAGHHNNIMYTDGFEIEVHNKTNRIETFGINFSIDAFVSIDQNGNEPLKRLCDQVLQKQNAICNLALFDIMFLVSSATIYIFQLLKHASDGAIFHFSCFLTITIKPLQIIIII